MRRSKSNRDQPSLFDRPISRATDPATSSEAAAAVSHKLGRCAARMLEAFETMGVTTNGGATASEAARHCVHVHGGNVETFRKRIGDLRVSGRIIEGEARRCDVTGHNATTYKVVR